MLASRMFFVLSALALVQAGCSSAATGKLGESCTRRADCSGGLYCVNQTCVSGAPEVAGLGARGETCSGPSDCQAGLVCVPIDTGSGAAGLGRCDLENYNLSPTGKTCWAECKQPIDCCEIPIGSQAVGGTSYQSCSDLKAVLGSNLSNCDTVNPPGLSRECFLFKTYCDCTTFNPWGCTSGKCEYNAACSADGEQIKGCPVLSRSGITLPSICTNSTCNPTSTAGCKNDTECVNKAVTDDPADSCTANECACITGGCYRKCSADLDCAQGYSCDVAQHVCVATGSCTVGATGNVFCARILHEVTAQCVNQVCKIPCTKDLDCSYSGLQGGTGFNGKVCSQGYCTDVGCTSDAECLASDGVTKLFCDTTPATATTSTVHSAVTD